MPSLQDIIIRAANPSDAEALTSLSITTFLETFSKDNRQEDMDKYIAEEMNLHRLTDELNDAGNVFFLAICGGVAAGYAKMRTLTKPAELINRKPIELERIYVLRQYHDKKVGAALMKRCIAHAISGGHDTLWLGVWEHNYRAVDFYTRWGFQLFGSHHFLLGNDLQTDVLMKKEL